MTAELALPIIDLTPFWDADGDPAARDAAVRDLDRACRQAGFFYITGHRVAPETVSAMDAAARAFFALPEAEKMRIAMPLAGAAWRGFFPVGGELTSGRPDLKEGVYFGTELGPDHPRVRAGAPMHGANLWPRTPVELRPAVETFMGQAAEAGHVVLRALALALGLDETFFAARYTYDPTLLFRMFHYPPARAVDGEWGVGEHTDYGLLTLLAQDDCGGLQVKTPLGWIEAPPIPGTFVCNLGDMLDRITGGVYRSNPHRVRNLSGRERMSYPLFFDPAWDAMIEPLPGFADTARDDSAQRWDGANVHAYEGTYGAYLLGKVGKVFPDLGKTVMPGPSDVGSP